MARPKDNVKEAKMRSQILNASKKCFIQHGFHQTSMRQIIDGSGISSGGVYHYFPSKESIVEAISTEEMTDIHFLVGRLQKKDNALDAVTQFVLDIVGNTPLKEAILGTEIFAEACRNIQIKEMVGHNNAMLKAALEATINTGQVKGEIMQEMTADELSTFIIALYEGLIGRIAIGDLSSKKAKKIASNSIKNTLRF
ncbi:TetR/AcrR family transcriptional regulator [Neptunomonas antarctica]|uniref:Transcriptional regulator, TetR family n=1 Tax=Neptunomonas antarctica TaxID=619304 RepID=A0A1N7NI81_9GAMM|nr:TetR/AcrR family transcriptional regulator [Neptunomonas antarctica]SIS97958.1 transcriptional regulator, TetR family [Neptunomonas antarctica]